MKVELSDEQEKLLKVKRSQPIPDFIDSPYFVMECDNWHLKDDAPDDLKKQFEEYMKGK